MSTLSPIIENAAQMRASLGTRLQALAESGSEPPAALVRSFNRTSILLGFATLVEQAQRLDVDVRQVLADLGIAAEFVELGTPNSDQPSQPVGLDAELASLLGNEEEN